MRRISPLGRIKHQVFQKASFPNLAQRAGLLAAGFNRSTTNTQLTSLSVVVPFSSGHQKAFQETILSLLQEDFSNLELVIAALDKGHTEMTALLDRIGCMKPFRVVLDEDIACPVRAFLAASHDVVTMLPAGDRFTTNALGSIRRVFSENGDMSLLYTDTMPTEKGTATGAGWHLKPAYDPVLLREVDYISGAAFFRRNRMSQILSVSRQGRKLTSMTELLRDYVNGLPDEAIAHLPFPALQTQTLPPMTPDAGAEIMSSRTSWPLISIVIPTRNGFELILQTLQGIYNGTDYPDFEVILIDNGSEDPRVLELYESYRSTHANFSAYVKTEPFNFSRAVNKGMSLAKGENILLLNNDIEVIEDGWLKEMVSCLELEKSGIVGARLLYPNDTIQHAGVIIGLNGMASHWFYKENKEISGPLGRLRVRNSMTCVTGAVMLISGDCRQALGDWDEKNFAIAYNDVDYCLRAHKIGFRVIWTPHATLYHHESVTRGKDRSRSRKEQFKREKAALKRIHKTDRFEDPAFSPWYARRPGKLKIRCPKKMPKVRTWWSS